MTLASLSILAARADSLLAQDHGWLGDGTPVAMAASLQSAPQCVSDGTGGVYISWQDYRDGPSRIFVQRLTSAGAVAPGWPVNGVGTIDGVDPTMALDPRGGVLVGVTSRFYGPWLARVGPDGTVFTAPSLGLLAGPSSQARDAGSEEPARALKQSEYCTPVLQPSPDGGMILAWSLVGILGENAFVLRYGPDMQLAPGWPGPTDADPAYYAKRASAVCSGDSGDVYAAWTRWNAVGVSRLTHEGKVAPGWPRTLEEFTESATDVGVGIVPDRQGGAIVIWQRPGAGVRAQRLSASGAAAPGWPLPWLPLSRFPGEPAITRYSSAPYWVRYVHQCAVVTDGTGGAYVTWSDQRADTGDVYVQRVLPRGTIGEGWPSDGLAVCAQPGLQRAPSLAPDGAGGVILAWQDARDGRETDVYAARIAPAGGLAPGWPAGGLRLCGQGGEQQIPRLAPDGEGGTIVAWQDGRCGDPHIFASRVSGDGALPPASPFPAVAAAFEAAEFGVGTVRLEWRVDGSSAPAELLRFGPEGGWATIAQSAPDAQGRVSFADSGMFAGCDYRYALRLEGCRRLGETTVTIPDANGFARVTASPVAGDLERCAPTLQWAISPGPVDTVRLYRREDDGPWTLADVLALDASRNIRVTDADAAPGTHSAYRLGLVSCAIERFSGEISIDVPPRDSALVATTTNVAFESAAVAITWHVPAASDSALVQKSEADGSWRTLQRVAMGGSETLRVRDRDVFGGCEYRYRVGLGDCLLPVWSAEAPVTVPTQAPFSVVHANVLTATVASGVPVVRWRISPGPLERVQLEHRTAESDWAPLTDLVADSTRLVAYQDASARTGVRHGYRLEIRTCGHTAPSGEAWLERPQALAPRFELAIRPAQPNPTHRPLRVAFSLPDASPAWVELHDALGRLMGRREVGSLGPGHHEITLGEGRILPPGLYWVRLLRGGQSLQTRVSLL